MRARRRLRGIFRSVWRFVWLRLGSLALLVAARWFGEAMPFSCAFKTLTGHPCTTCGMTRAWSLAAHGDFVAASAQSPLGLVSFLAAIAIVFLPLPRVRFEWLFAALAINWAYTLLAGVA